MASRSGAQAKLNRVVKIIAEAMSCEVCSIYLLRDGVLELFATVGLNQSAVHVTRLAMGEGLVGTIADQAAVLNLDERVESYVVESENFESIHNHSAYALIERNKRDR